MGRYKQKSDGKGSLKCLQVLVNKYPDILNNRISELINKKNIRINWLSPVEKDGYAEYSDEDFLEKILSTTKGINLNKFWPRGGPHWDGLGRADTGEIYLIEAKANIPEIVSPPTYAKDKNALNLIKESLEETKKYLNATSHANWASYFYQYTNRLAHLYLLRVKNKAPVYLIFIYFVGDKSVNGPGTEAEWKAALTVMKKYLGIDKAHRLSKYVLDIFIDAKEINL